MKLSDLFHFAWQSQTQHKLRSSLTLLGVILGAFLVVVTVSIGQGVQEVIPRLMRQNDRLRRIDVHQTYDPVKVEQQEVLVDGVMSAERHARILKAKKMLAAQNSGGTQLRPLTDERLAEIAALEHVESALPMILSGATLRFRDQPTFLHFMSATVQNRDVSTAIVAGRNIQSNDAAEVLHNEVLAYDLGFHNEADLAQLLGSTVRLELNDNPTDYTVVGNMLEAQSRGKVQFSRDEKRQLDEIIRMLPVVADQLKLPAELQQLLKKALTQSDESATGEALKPPPQPVIAKSVSTPDLTVVGIFRDSIDYEDRNYEEHFGDHVKAVVSVEVGRDFMRQAPGFDTQGYSHAIVRVDEERNLRPVVEWLRLHNYNNAHSLVEIVERLQHQYGLMLWSMTALGIVALLISAIGITNTMLMAVLERTREIGIMKAVGAKDGQIQAIFLTEGVFVGLVGAALALVSAWGASKYANSWIQEIVAREANQPVDDQLFLFPWWLIAGIFVITLTVTLLAAWLPARRAARILPVIALRHD